MAEETQEIQDNQEKKPSFFTLVPSRKQKELTKVEVPTAKAELTNNIHLGEISEDLVKEIKPGKTLQARFTNLELSIRYKVKVEDTRESALEGLRHALFCAQHGKPFDANSSSESARHYPHGLAVALMNSIAPTGEIDAVVQIF